MIELANKLCREIKDLPDSEQKTIVSDMASDLNTLLNRVANTCSSEMLEQEARDEYGDEELKELCAHGVRAVKRSQTALAAGELANTALLKAEAIKDYVAMYHSRNQVERFQTQSDAMRCFHEFEAARAELELSSEAINAIDPVIYQIVLDFVETLDSVKAQEYAGALIVTDR